MVLQKPEKLGIPGVMENFHLKIIQFSLLNIANNRFLYDVFLGVGSNPDLIYLNMILFSILLHLNDL